MSIDNYRWLRDEAKAEFPDAQTMAHRAEEGNLTVAEIRRWARAVEKQAQLLADHQTEIEPNEIVVDALYIRSQAHRIVDIHNANALDAQRSPESYRSTPQLSQRYAASNSQACEDNRKLQPLYEAAKALEPVLMKILQPMIVAAITHPDCTKPEEKIRLGQSIVHACNDQEKPIVAGVILAASVQAALPLHHSLCPLMMGLNQAGKLTAADKDNYLALRLRDIRQDSFSQQYAVDLLPFATSPEVRMSLIDMTINAARDFARKRGSRDIDFSVKRASLTGDEWNMMEGAKFALKHPKLDRLFKLVDVKLDWSQDPVPHIDIFQYPRPAADKTPTAGPS